MGPGLHRDGQAWRNAPGTVSELWTELHGEAINPFIASVVADAEHELLTAQPQAGRSAAALAVIPGHAGLHVALAVREPSIVAYLVDMFERTWEHGRPFANQESTVRRDIAAEQRAMTIRMLLAGHADPVSAKRLGFSPRTYAAYVADLKTEFDAQTRFQLGYAMGRRGVSGQEPGRGDDGTESD